MENVKAKLHLRRQRKPLFLPLSLLNPRFHADKPSVILKRVYHMCCCSTARELAGWQQPLAFNDRVIVFDRPAA